MCSQWHDDSLLESQFFLNPFIENIELNCFSLHSFSHLPPNCCMWHSDGTKSLKSTHNQLGSDENGGCVSFCLLNKRNVMGNQRCACLPKPVVHILYIPCKVIITCVHSWHWPMGDSREAKIFLSIVWIITDNFISFHSGQQQLASVIIQITLFSFPTTFYLIKF